MAKKPASVLTPDALPEIVKNGIAGAYVFFGDEDYLKTVWLDRIAKSVMTSEGFEIFNRFSVSFTDEKSGAAKLADALFASPMMQEKTLVEVHDLAVSGARSSVIDTLCETLSHISPDTVAIVIFRSDELSFDYKIEQSPVYKKLSQVASVVEFDLLPDAKLVAWAKKLLAAKKITISDGAAGVLVDMCSRRMFSLLGETEKLAAYKKYGDGSSSVTEEDVRTVCTQNAKDELPFAMSDAASKWNLKEILSVFEMSRDQQEEPISVVSKLGRIYADMLKMKAALDGGMTVSSAAKALGMNEYRAGLVARSVQNVPVAVIENALLLTYETDIRLKSTQTDKWVLLDGLAAKIYTPRSLRGENA